MSLMALNHCFQIVAAIMAITGIVMMAYADGFHGDSFVGVALAVGSASTSALYKVGPPRSLYVEPILWLAWLQKLAYWLVSSNGLSPPLPGDVKDVPRKRQPWRSGSLSFHHGLLQSHLHLLRAPHPLLYQGGVLGLTLLSALGIHVWPGRTVAGWACTYILTELGSCFFHQFLLRKKDTHTLLIASYLLKMLFQLQLFALTCFKSLFPSLTVFNILVHVGVVLTYPILISIGTLLSVPGNAGLDLSYIYTLG